MAIQLVVSLRFEDFVDGCKLKLSKQALAEKDKPPLTDKDIPALCSFLNRNPHLIDLDVSNNYLTSIAAQLLSNIKTILILNIYGNQLEEAGAEHISKMYQLKELDIGKNNIGARGTYAVAKLQLHHLSKLNIFTTGTVAQATEITFEPSVSKFSIFINTNVPEPEPCRKLMCSK